MPDLYGEVIGQDRAVAQLQAASQRPVHAYLFVGPRGSGKQLASLSFAAQLLCGDNGCGTCDICIRAIAGVHPDVVVVERVGAAISVDQAREIVRVAMRSPLEGERQVIVLTDFHLVDEAAPALLKTIEEPPAATIFVIHAEFVPATLSTIASRCVRVDFAAVEKVIEDPDAIERMNFWKSIPQQLNGTGARVVELSNAALATLDEAAAAIEEKQAIERDEFAEQVKQMGGSAGERKEFEAKQKRELRRERTDELRNGLVTLGYAYRDIALETGSATALSAAEAVIAAEKRLLRNPNESLLLDALFAQLDSYADKDALVVA